MAKQKTRQQLEQELDRVKSFCFWESASKVIQTAIRWGVCGLLLIALLPASTNLVG